MFANKKRKNFFPLSIILLIFLLLVFSIFTPGFKGVVDQEVRIITKNTIILDGRKPIKESIPNILIAFKDLITFNKKNFETLRIDINYENFDTLNQDRSKALKEGILRNPSRANAQIFWKGKKINTSVRLKGDFNDHRNFNKQWSLKFNLKNSDHLNGMTEFSLTNHRSRNFPHNFIISKNLNRMGLHVPKYKTVKVEFNGYDWGLMLIEEHFTKEFLENRKLKNSLIFKISDEESMVFEHIHHYRDKIINSEEYKTLTRWQDKININYHNKNKIIKGIFDEETINFMKTLTIMKNINENLNFVEISKQGKFIENYFDIKSFSKMFVSSLAWSEGQFHSMELNNSRFYLNPFNLKIQPIPADYEFIFKMYGTELNDDEISRVIANSMFKLPKFYQSIFWNQKFQNIYLETLNEFDKNLPLIEKDIETVCLEYNKICNNIANVELLKKNVSILKRIGTDIFNVYMKHYSEEKTVTQINADKLLEKNNYNNLKYHNLYKKHLYSRVFSNGKFELINLSNVDIELDSIIIDDNIYYLKEDFLLDASKYSKASYKKIDLNIKPEINKLVQINYSFPKDKNIKTYNTFVEKEINISEIDSDYFDFKKNNIKIEDKDIIFDAKEYNINKPIYIKDGYNLNIKPGTKLIFSENSYILIENGSLKILGKADNQITFTAKNKSWKGIHVINDDNLSIIEHAKFSKLNYFDNEKFSLTGAINFYNSNVKIYNSIFNEVYSEDAINFIHTKFIVKNCRFNTVLSDAIDSDFSEGKVIKTNFYKIDGDGIDTSGSNVKINDVLLDYIGDKGISVGEESLVSISNVEINGSNIGIASKDGSKVMAKNLIIKNSTNYDLASYNKKKTYKGGNLSVEKIDAAGKYLSQVKSELFIDGKKIPNKKFNSKDLY